MTRRATVNDARVIKDRACKCTRGVTNTAVLIGLWMRGRFALREDAVVTGRAVVNDSHMIESRGHKTRRVVTLDAIG